MGQLEPLRVRAGLSLPASCLSLRFSRAGGPGGQNVNKVESAVELLFDLEGTSALSEAQRRRLRERLAGRIDGAGQISVRSSTFREQGRNLAAARERLARLLDEALKVQKPRVATRPTRSAARRRLESKRNRGAIKRGRGGAGGEE